MDDYLAANRALWDEWTAIHELSSFYDLESFKAGGSRLRAYEVNEVGEVAGKSLLHLQCHFGIDALSWARHGARVTGADFSARAVELARSLAAELPAQVRQPVEYGWAHSMGEIVTAVAGAGLRIEFLHELPFVDWPLRFLVRHDDGTWRLPPDAAGELPLFFSLRATSP